MMDNTPENLPLRDIHLPDAVSWWPLAPGWWLLFLMIILMVTAAVFLYRRYRRKRNSPLRQAQLALQQIRDNFSRHRDQQQLIKDLSGLLRRTAVSLHKRDDVASITGEDWLVYLDSHTQDQPFTRGVGRILESGPYQKHSEANPDELFDLCENWLKNIKMDRAA